MSRLFRSLNNLQVAFALFLSGAFQANAKPLNVFILAGQSNMQGHAHIRTFDVMAHDPKTAPMLKEMRGEDGSPRVCDQVWISSIGSSPQEKTGKLTTGFGASNEKIGPEYTFGIYMQKHLDEPFLIIKTAWGGKSIHTDFRPPSAGPFKFREDHLKKLADRGKDINQIQAEKIKSTGRYYHLMIDHVEKVLRDIKQVYPDYDSGEGYQLAGFVWFQGWNDMVDSSVYPDRGKPGGYDDYSKNLAHFIRDIRKDLNAPELPFVIGVMGTGGPIDQYPPEKKRYANIHGEFRKAMATPASLPEFKNTVSAVRTENYWDMELEKLRAMDRKIQSEIKALAKSQQISKPQQKERLEMRRADVFSDKELYLLENGASNAEYPYLGSAKILGGIGKAFADEMYRLMAKD